MLFCSYLIVDFLEVIPSVNEEEAFKDIDVAFLVKYICFLW